jgi:hypothetical protein
MQSPDVFNFRNNCEIMCVESFLLDFHVIIEQSVCMLRMFTKRVRKTGCLPQKSGQFMCDPLRDFNDRLLTFIKNENFTQNNMNEWISSITH